MGRMRLEARLLSVTYWPTTIVVMATFDSGQLVSLRSLTEVSAADVPNTRAAAFGEGLAEGRRFIDALSSCVDGPVSDLWVFGPIWN
jgi:hypothetical protein